LPRITVYVIIRVRNQGTEHVFDSTDSKARKACPWELWKIAGRKFDQLNRVPDLESLRIPPGNRLEALKDDRKEQHSIRINDQYRICFRWDDGAHDVEIVDYHR
jgi:proteic killer suppression protein